MGIRINENIFSLLVNRNLVRANNNLETSFRRLGSGEKITRSGDDPAGLANSQMLRAKISGLQRTLMNSGEGLNLLGIAESSLNEVTEILQRMRELAVQTSSDVLSDEQRVLVQAEVTQLLDEIQRVATTANYNERNLLDGTFANLRLQVGTRQGDSMPISIEDARTSILGAVAQATGTQTLGATPIVGNGDLTINGVAVPQSVFDGISALDGDASAMAKAKAINDITFRTQVTAEVEPGVFTSSGATIAAGSLNGTTRSLTINGINLGAVNFQSGDSDGVLRGLINGKSSLTGVEASLGQGGELVLTGTDGRNVRIETTGAMADDLGLALGNTDINVVLRGRITLTSAKTIQVAGNGALIGFAAGQATTTVDPTTAIENLKVTTSESSQDALRTIDTAMRQVLSRRATLGSLESRVNKTIEDIQVNIENLSSADSRIRDADFALETTNLTQAQIIQEAGVAILAQANVVPQMALRLLER